MVKILLEAYEKELQSTNEQKFKIEKIIERKNDNCMSNAIHSWIIHSIVGLIKKMSYKNE